MFSSTCLCGTFIAGRSQGGASYISPSSSSCHKNVSSQNSFKHFFKQIFNNIFLPKLFWQCYGCYEAFSEGFFWRFLKHFAVNCIYTFVYVYNQRSCGWWVSQRLKESKRWLLFITSRHRDKQGEKKQPSLWEMHRRMMRLGPFSTDTKTFCVSLLFYVFFQLFCVYYVFIVSLCSHFIDFLTRNVNRSLLTPSTLTCAQQTWSLIHQWGNMCNNVIKMPHVLPVKWCG